MADFIRVTYSFSGSQKRAKGLLYPMGDSFLFAARTTESKHWYHRSIDLYRMPEDKSTGCLILVTQGDEEVEHKFTFPKDIMPILAKFLSAKTELDTVTCRW